MAAFIIRFLICNFLISLFTGILLALKHLLQNRLSSRMQYRLWFLLLVILAIPLLPALPVSFHPFRNFSAPISPQAGPQPTAAGILPSAAASGWVSDFTLSVTRDTSSAAWNLLFILWIAGILVMVFAAARSNIRFIQIRKSALPLQNPRVCWLYRSCLAELKVTGEIPIYSTAFLKSPISVGFFRPGIYLPIHLISGPEFRETTSGCQNPDTPKPEFRERDLRYMLLHELQHCRHRDALPNLLMNLALLFYWFNPLIWLASREMRCDREVACDASVLRRLPESEYTEYGHTLLRFAHQCSRSPFPFTTGFHNGMYQMKRRIVQIAAYRTPSFAKKMQSFAAFSLIAVLMLGFAPVLAPFAADDSHFYWNPSSHNISYVDVSSYFGELEGSLILYDFEDQVWFLANPGQALTRVSPDSTYKIYDALFGLDAGIITPEHSLLAWDGRMSPIAAWNQDHTLSSALANSVNWYFQSIDHQLGSDSVFRYLKEIGYGNETIGRDLSSYWMESELKISPLEQMILLTKLYQGKLPFAPEHVSAVLEGLYIPDSEIGPLYGKTGTGRVNGKDVNGWFIGYAKDYGQKRHTVFFVLNIQGEDHANGSTAAKLLTDLLPKLLPADR